MPTATQDPQQQQTDWFGQNAPSQAATSPGGGDWFASNAPKQAQPPPKDSFWRQVYDRSGLGALQKEAGQLSEWASQKAQQAQTEQQTAIAKTGQNPEPMAAYSKSAGYDMLARTSGLISSFLDPKSVAITGGVIAANTNPFTGIPVDAALVAHGGYGVYKNAPGAFRGEPEATQNMFLSASEMAGGGAGVAGQVRALPGAVRSVQNAFGSNQQPGAAGNIASVLGVKDPPPNQLLTKAVKPLASNTGWDSAIAKAAPDMKAAEVQLGHQITGVDDALTAVSIAKKGIWQQYADKLSAAQKAMPNAPSMSTIDGNEIADAMIGSIDQRTALQNPDLVERIQKIADTYRRPMQLQEAEDFLQSANNDLHSYYAKNKVGRQVAAKDPATGYVVAEADQLRDSLYSTLDNLTGPGAADLKGRYGALSNVENELLRRKNVSARQQPDSMAEQLSMARAYGKIAVGVARMSPSSLLEGTQSLAAAKWLKTRGLTDSMITRAFQALDQPAEAAPVTQAVPRTGSGIGAAAGTMSDDSAQRLLDLLKD
ncbi:MAG TPA: hypothetical protein VOA78_15355 [Candidatus Dormibacteraeota bacterium]|nr:hypothetical protein [Candidatus Dormibacteraeota bacterium]